MRNSRSRYTQRHGHAPAGIGEFRAVAGQILDAGARYLERGRDWLESGATGSDRSRREGEWNEGRAAMHGRSNRGYGAAPAGRQTGGEAGVETSSGDQRGNGPRGYVRSDDRILEDLCEQLCDDPLVDARQVDPRCEGGCIVLEGEFSSRWMKHRVEDIADGIMGAKEVENRLRVGRGHGRESSATDGGRGSQPQGRDDPASARAGDRRQAGTTGTPGQQQPPQPH